MPRNNSSAPVVLPPGLLIEITTPETALDSPTRFKRSLVRWLPAMKPSTDTRAIWDRAGPNGDRPAAARPAVTTAAMRPSTPSARQKESLRRKRRRSAIASGSKDMSGQRPLWVTRPKAEETTLACRKGASRAERPTIKKNPRETFARVRDWVGDRLPEAVTSDRFWPC